MSGKLVRLIRPSAVAMIAGGLLSEGCDGPPGPGPDPPLPATTATVVAAGDIGMCGFGALDTGRQLDALSGTVLPLGDLAYPHGRPEDFLNCYDPGWGRHKERSRPVPGNHEYETPGAAGYYDYFGLFAGPRGLGYYAFTAGPWRLIGLNSEISMAPGSPQMQWLREELQNTHTTCTLAYWHRPLFSSGQNDNNPDTRPLWSALIEFGADVVLNGHDHLYERFEPQDEQGRLDPVRGLRQFTVGTGGASRTAPRAPKPNSVVRSGASYGVLVMTLTVNSYSWQFASVDNSFNDSGAGTCR